MKPTAVLSNNIILKPHSAEHAIALKQATTYKFIDKFKSQVAKREIGTVVRNYSTVGAGILAIPIGRQELIDDKYEIKDERTVIEVNFPEPTKLYPLRPSQQFVLDNVVDNCLINAPVSWGKTFTALHIAAKLRQKTLVITHTTILRDQWAAEVKKLLGITCGIIGGGVMEGMDSPIVISNVQTLIKFIDKIDHKTAFKMNLCPLQIIQV